MPPCDKLRSMLFQRIRDYAVQNGIQVEITQDTRLFGRGALLDSLGLVMILASFEADINDSFGTEIVLANERAMSLERSPFQTVSTLIDYACALIDDQGKGS